MLNFHVDYDDFSDVIRVMAALSEDSSTLFRTLVSKREELESGEWRGLGASAFYDEMETVLLPAFKRLENCWEMSYYALQTMYSLIKDAEDEAARLFTGTDNWSRNLISLDIWGAFWKTIGNTPVAKRAGEVARVGAATDSGNGTNYQNALGLPQYPQPPSLDKLGGSGEHGAGGSATSLDNLNRNAWYGVADTAEVIGYDDAARHMRHYLDDSGEPLDVNVSEMLQEIPGFADKTQTIFHESLIEDINRRIKQDYNGQPLTFQASTGWVGYYAETGNWFFASGGYSFAYGAEVTVTPDTNGNAQVDINYQLHVYDRYNWDAGKSVRIVGLPVPDTFLGRLHQVGIAKEYDLRGSSKPEHYQYTYTP